MCLSSTLITLCELIPSRRSALAHITDDPLSLLTHNIASASSSLENESFRSEEQSEDPLELLERRVASGKRAASFAPPLTGLVADIEAAAHLRDHAATTIDDAECFDVLERLSPRPKAPVEPVKSVMLTPKKAAPRGAQGATPSTARPVSPPVTRPEQTTQRPSGGGVIASVLIDAIATRPLPGAARAEAARLLSEGIALGDEALMREALATLITGV